MISVKFREMIATKLGVFLLFTKEYGLHQREKPVFVWFPNLSPFRRRFLPPAHKSDITFTFVQPMESHSTVQPRSILIALKLL